MNVQESLSAEPKACMEICVCKSFRKAYKCIKQSKNCYFIKQNIGRGHCRSGRSMTSGVSPAAIRKQLEVK